MHDYGFDNLFEITSDFDASTVTNAYELFYQRQNIIIPENFSLPNATETYRMFGATKGGLTKIPNGFSIPNTQSANSMFDGNPLLTTIGDNVKIANGPNATSTDDTSMNKSLITSIGSNFEWFTNATFDGTWDPALGIRNVFPNATSVGSGWKVYDHYDGE